MSYSVERERVFKCYLLAATAAAFLRSPDVVELGPESDPRVVELESRLLDLARDALEISESLESGLPGLRLV